jgi:hypothetical protein
MVDIDFLPIEYRRKHLHRRQRSLHITGAVLILALLVAAAVAQHIHWRSVQAELAEISPAFEAATRLQSQWKNVQKRLKDVRARAELYTYLRHPWPRSQLLAAVLRPLPDDITLQQVHILHEPTEASAAGTSDGKSKAARQEWCTAASRDLAGLRDRMDSTQTVVVLMGTATASSTLHRYLGALDSNDILSKTELDWFDNADEGKSVRFRVVLAVQPGYGQRGSPRLPDGNLATKPFRGPDAPHAKVAGKPR